MDNLTVPSNEPFDQHDIVLETQRLLDPILKRGDNEEHRLSVLAAFGRKLCFSRSSVSREQRLEMYRLMCDLRMDGILVMPTRLLTHNLARVLTYEEICRQIYAEVSK